MIRNSIVYWRNVCNAFNFRTELNRMRAVRMRQRHVRLFYERCFRIGYKQWWHWIKRVWKLRVKMCKRLASVISNTSFVAAKLRIDLAIHQFPFWFVILIDDYSAANVYLPYSQIRQYSRTLGSCLHTNRLASSRAWDVPTCFVSVNWKWYKNRLFDRKMKNDEWNSFGFSMIFSSFDSWQQI